MFGPEMTGQLGGCDFNFLTNGENFGFSTMELQSWILILSPLTLPLKIERLVGESTAISSIANLLNF